MADFEAREGLERLYEELANDRPVAYDDDPLYFNGNDAEFAALSIEIEQIEDAWGVELPDHLFARAVIMAQDLGGSAERAMRTLVTQEADAQQEWEDTFQESLTPIADEIERRVMPKEEQALREYIIENGEDPANAPNVWRRLWGKRHSDEEVQRLRAKFKEDLEGVRAKYSDGYAEAWEKEHRQKLDEDLAEMRKSGRGMYDLSDQKSIDEYYADHAEIAREAEANERNGLPEGTDTETRREVIADEMQEDGLDDFSSRSAYMDLKINGVEPGEPEHVSHQDGEVTFQ